MSNMMYNIKTAITKCTLKFRCKVRAPVSLNMCVLGINAIFVARWHYDTSNHRELQPQHHSNIAVDLNLLLRTHIHFVVQSVYEERSLSVSNNLKLCKIKSAEIST